MLRRPSQDELSSLERLPGIPEIVLSADTALRVREGLLPSLVGAQDLVRALQTW